MNLNLFERFTKLSLVRAAFWLVMGISLLIMPKLEFLLNGLFYMLIGYLFVNAILRTIFFARERTTVNKHNNASKSVIPYISLGIAILFVIAAVHLIIFREWLNEFTPVFLGGLLMLEGILYFVIALCAVTSLQKSLLIIISGAVFLGAAIAIAFTFGFGVGGVTVMTRILGIALLLAFLYEISAFYTYRRNKANTYDKEGVK